jgi:hypothetical protein
MADWSPAGLAAVFMCAKALRDAAVFDKGVRDIERKNTVFVTVLVLLHLFCSSLSARPTTAHQARKVVTGWLRADFQPLGTALGRGVLKVDTFTDSAGEPVYHVVYLQPSGFVVVSADDSVEPIIAFADDGTYDPSLGNPLGALVSQDLNERVTAARTPSHPKAGPQKPAPADHQNKWNQFASIAEASENTFAFMGTISPSDIRVAPLLQSKWSQSYVCGNSCYNYYTPDNYRCGCVATTMAQLMRYHQYPVVGIGVQGFWIRKDYSDWYAAYTRGGDGAGGPYKWSDMVAVPDCSTTLTQRQAIGALCYDAAISINTNFCSDHGEADTRQAKDALINTFQYGNAVKGYNAGANIGPGLIKMINPNLDAKDPVILGVNGSSSHAVLCDGYGYNYSTLYHHLNMGWGGTYDAWYNLPTIDCDPAYSLVYKCVYNIHITDGGNGEVVSGRILNDKGHPIANATVDAKPNSRVVYIRANSDGKGIYAFDSLSSNTVYTISPVATGYVFQSRSVVTGTSSDNSANSGNVWGVDFYGQVLIVSDLNHDGVVDMADFAVFTSAWLAKPGDASWNPDCDISTPADDFIDAQDLAVFVQDWLASGQ